MEIRRSQIGEVVVLGLQGKFISDAETTKLETAIDAETEAGTSRLVIDMSECAAMNSTALGILVKTRNVFERRGARVKLSALPPLIWQTKLYLIFDCHDTQAEAVAAFAD